MTFAYMFLSTDPNKSEDVVKELQKKKFFIEGYKVSEGKHDMLIKIIGDDFSDIGDNIINDIRTIPGVYSTKTMLCMNSI